MSAIDFSVFRKVALAPIAAAVLLALLWRDVARASKAPVWRPWLFAAGFFLAGFIGLAISIFAYNVPYARTVWETAARDNALMLAGAACPMRALVGL